VRLVVSHRDKAALRRFDNTLRNARRRYSLAIIPRARRPSRLTIAVTSRAKKRLSSDSSFSSRLSLSLSLSISPRRSPEDAVSSATNSPDVTHERTASRFDTRVIYVPRFTYRARDLAARQQRGSHGFVTVGDESSSQLEESESKSRFEVTEARTHRASAQDREGRRNALRFCFRRKLRRKTGASFKRRAGLERARCSLDLYSRRNGKVAACADRSNSSCSPPLAANGHSFSPRRSTRSIVIPVGSLALSLVDCLGSPTTISFADVACTRRTRFARSAGEPGREMPPLPVPPAICRRHRRARCFAPKSGITVGSSRREGSRMPLSECQCECSRLI